MHGDEVRPHDAIAIEKDAIVAMRGQDRAIADFGGTEAAVLMPDMRQWMSELGFPGLHQFGGLRAGTVVRDHHLEIPVGLPRQAPQHRRQRILAPVGGHDDGDQTDHGLISGRAKSEIMG